MAAAKRGKCPEMKCGKYRLLYTLKARKGAGLNHDVKCIMPAGSIICVSDIKYLSVSVWGKAKEGWFCLYMGNTPYVR